MYGHHRRSIRLRGYDYTQAGAYFVTICAHRQAHVFGQVIDGAMVLNDWGAVVQQEWANTAEVRPNIELDAFVVMPNHLHGIIVITDAYGKSKPHGTRANVGAQCIAPVQPHSSTHPNASMQQPKSGVTPNNVAPNSLGAIVRAFKAAATRTINRHAADTEHPIWQRNYHEHIIRSEVDLNRIRAYVENNPARWCEDKFYGA